MDVNGFTLNFDVWTDWLVCWCVQVLALAQLVGLPLQDQANFLMRRALLCKANGQPLAAFTNCLHAAQVPPSVGLGLPACRTISCAPWKGCNVFLTCHYR